MKRGFLWLAIGAAALWLPGQVHQPSPAPSIEIPVRVLAGDTAVADLALSDFELIDAGQAQRIESLRWVRGATVERSEGPVGAAPAVQRRFTLLFQLLSFEPRLVEALDHLFESVLRPGDTLMVVTPDGQYTLSEKALAAKPPQELARELSGLVRRDTAVGTAAYNTILRDLNRLAAGMGSGRSLEALDETTGTGSIDLTTLEMLLPRYREGLDQLEQLRFIDEARFFEFARTLKAQPGRHEVFLFYEREFRPEINHVILNRMMSLYQENTMLIDHLQELFVLFNRKPRFDPRRVLAAFIDAGFHFNFIFINTTAPEAAPEVTMTEQSEDFFAVFKEAARTTGGWSEATQNPAAAFKKMAALSEGYYLLSYRPWNYIKDGEFKRIQVFVKGTRDLTVHHPDGYFASR